jgi:hypothetical protein
MSKPNNIDSLINVKSQINRNRFYFSRENFLFEKFIFLNLILISESSSALLVSKTKKKKKLTDFVFCFQYNVFFSFNF